jgi:hypothetical protein
MDSGEVGWIGGRWELMVCGNLKLDKHAFRFLP